MQEKKVQTIFRDPTYITKGEWVPPTAFVGIIKRSGVVGCWNNADALLIDSVAAEIRPSNADLRFASRPQS